MSDEPLTFDPTDPSYLANPYPTLRRLRNEAPVYWWERGHMWLLSRYADVEPTLKDPRFSTDIRSWRHYQHHGGMPASILEIRERGLLPGVIEEVLRHDSFMAMGVPRYALEDVEVRGQTIAKGDMLMLLLPAAMHDEDVWPDAERFDIEREPTPNLSFGRGPHFCLGAHLARLEARVVLRTLLTHFPRMDLAGEPTFRPHPLVRQMGSLPVRLRPSAQA